MGRNLTTVCMARQVKVEKAVLIAKDSNEIRVYRLDQGVSQTEAESIAKEDGAGIIDKVTMGYFQDQHYLGSQVGRHLLPDWF